MLLSPPALDVRLLTALQVLQVLRSTSRTYMARQHPPQCSGVSTQVLARVHTCLPFVGGRELFLSFWRVNDVRIKTQERTREIFLKTNKYKNQSLELEREFQQYQTTLTRTLFLCRVRATKRVREMEEKISLSLSKRDKRAQVFCFVK